MDGYIGVAFAKSLKVFPALSPNDHVRRLNPNFFGRFIESSHNVLSRSASSAERECSILAGKVTDKLHVLNVAELFGQRADVL